MLQISDYFATHDGKLPAAEIALSLQNFKASSFEELVEMMDFICNCKQSRLVANGAYS
jgi:hypothetical protein